MPLECDHIRNEFSALLDNELNPEDRELVEEHLSDCSDCLRELHGYKMVSDAYRYHHPVKAPDDFEERFRAAIAPIGRRRPAAWRRTGLALAACGAGLIGVFLWRSLGGGAPSFELASFQADETAKSVASAPMAESAAPVEAPEAMMFQAPAAEPVGAEPGPNGPQAVDSTAQSGDMALPENDVARRMDLSGGGAGGFQDTGLGAGGFGGGAADTLPRTANAPAPDAVPDGDATALAMKSEPVAQALPEVAPATPKEAEMDAATPGAARERLAQGTGRAAAESAPADTSATATLIWRDQSFSLVDGAWRQDGYSNETLTAIAIPSAEWNALLDRHIDLTALCDREEAVIVKLDEAWYRITKTPSE